jgi:hypothetical protein
LWEIVLCCDARARTTAQTSSVCARVCELGVHFGIMRGSQFSNNAQCHPERAISSAQAIMKDTHPQNVLHVLIYITNRKLTCISFFVNLMFAYYYTQTQSQTLRSATETTHLRVHINQQQSEFLGTKLTSNQQHQPASDINKVSKRRTIRRKKLICISSRGYRLCAHPLFMFISLFACLFELRNLPFTLPGLPITRSFR